MHASLCQWGGVFRARRALAVLAAAGVLAAAPAQAHFLEVIPSRSHVAAGQEAPLGFDIRFTHPMEMGPVMEMAPPRHFGVAINGKMRDLTDRLSPRVIDGATAYTASYAPERPGDHVFFVEPAPYWEPAEGKMIVHYAKVVVDAFGRGGGWDRPVGLPVEIVPLTRPYGLWTGNVFRGLVLKDGVPVPGAEVEVEWRNDGSVNAPTDAHVTQVVKADGQGVFAYAMPRAGWWGFAALVEGGSPMPNPKGEPVPVELGGLMWVRAVDMR